MAVTMANPNKPKALQTAEASKYPQGYFKDKPCRCCKINFKPKAPSELYCSDICKDKGIHNAYLIRNYGITFRTYRLMMESQNSLCKICGSEGFIMDADRHKMKLVIDHDHKTGKVRGLLCHNCNRALGLLHDSVDNFKAAIAYLNA